MSKWTLFSNHGHVLLFLSTQPDARLRDVATGVGITERAVQTIIRDLQEGGYVTVTRHGRRNRYRIHTRKSLRHDLESHCTVGHLTRLMEGRGMNDDQDRERVPRPATGPGPGEAPRVPEEAAETPVPVTAAEPEAAAPGEKRKKRKHKTLDDDGEQGSLF